MRERILSAIARRAYRGPVTESDIRHAARVLPRRSRRRWLRRRHPAGAARILASPRFLFRIESEPAPKRGAKRHGQAYRVSDIDLASRLSFFLWSSIPDEELLDVAVKGTLSDRADAGTRRCAECSPIAARRRWSTTSRASGSTIGELSGVVPDVDAYPGVRREPP